MISTAESYKSLTPIFFSKDATCLASLKNCICVGTADGYLLLISWAGETIKEIDLSSIEFIPPLNRTQLGSIENVVYSEDLEAFAVLFANGGACVILAQKRTGKVSINWPSNSPQGSI